MTTLSVRDQICTRRALVPNVTHDTLLGDINPLSHYVNIKHLFQTISRRLCAMSDLQQETINTGDVIRSFNQTNEQRVDALQCLDDQWQPWRHY